MLHGMARSKKKGVAPAAGDQKKRDALNRGEGGVMEAGNTRAAAASAGKKRSKKSAEKKRKSRHDEEMKGAVLDIHGGDEDEGSTGGTHGAQTKSNRDVLRDKVMRQVRYKRCGAKCFQLLVLSNCALNGFEIHTETNRKNAPNLSSTCSNRSNRATFHSPRFQISTLPIKT